MSFLIFKKLRMDEFHSEFFLENQESYIGGNAGNWTRDHHLKRVLLYQLSYVPIATIVAWLYEKKTICLLYFPPSYLTHVAKRGIVVQ